MRRDGRRVRLDTGIYRDSAGVSVMVYANGSRQERRFPRDTSLRVLKAARDDLRTQLRNRRPRSTTGTLARDAERYIKQMRHLASYVERRAEVRAWTAKYGRQLRHRLTSEHVRQAIGDWTEAGYAPKTINNRVHTLRHLYRTLDGRAAMTPCDEVAPLTVPKTIPVAVSPDVIRAVEKQMREQERTGRLRSQKTRARFMVLAATGKRPSELMRAEPDDVDLERRVWLVRDGKGGWSPGLYLNNDMLTAWRLFIEANAWGWFSVKSFARRLRTSGWPKGVRPYNLRHSTGIALSEGGTDLADIQAFMGHKQIATTRRHYVPVLNSRMQKASEQIDGRIGWEHDEAGD